MGTTLTGTTPATTYDSLIKVTDNGPLSATAKYLTDGLGNDSVLALSTSAVGIGTNSPSVALEVNGSVRFVNSTSAGPDLEFGNIGGSTKINNVAAANIYYGAYAHLFTNNDNSVERMRITSAGAVGIGTSNPQGTFHAEATSASQNLIASSGNATFRIANSATSASRKEFTAILDTTNNRVDIQAIHQGVATLPITLNASGGNVGIGTSSPQQKTHIASIADNSYGLMTTATNWASNMFTGIKIGSTGDTYSAGVDLRSYSSYSTNAKTELALWVNNSSNTMVEVVRATQNGLTFNGDTAAANALDDYEEGTFTLTFAGNTVAGTYTPINVNATYTKIGRMVTLQYKASFAGGASGGSGDMIVSGLPFAYPSGSGGMTANIVLASASWGGSYLSMLPTTSASSNTLIIVETAPSTALTTFVQASDFGTSTDIRFTLTYQV